MEEKEQPDILSSGSERWISYESQFSDDSQLSDRWRGPSRHGSGSDGPGGDGPGGDGPGGVPPRRDYPGRRTPRRLNRRGRVTLVLAGALLTCLGVSLGLTRLGNQHQPAARTEPTAARTAASPAPVIVARPAISGTAFYALPGPAQNSFSVIALAVRPSPDSAPLTWLFVYGRDIRPGQRYGLLEDTCDGEYVTANDVADGTADGRGFLTIVARNLDISPTASNVWIMLYRLEDGAPMGGVQGPLTGQGAKTFRSLPPC